MGDENEEQPPAAQDEVLNGSFQFPDGGRYVGSYLKKGADGSVLMHGEGRLINGPETFIGVFENGAMTKGKYIGGGGGTYEGKFLDNKFHGLGEYRWPDGRTYRGMWSNGSMHGRGQYENFSFGADKLFDGVSEGNQFHSNKERQRVALAEYVATYAGPMLSGAKQALKGMAEAAEFGDLVSFDPPGRVKSMTPEEAPVAGPHPSPDSVQAAALAGLAGGLEAAEGEDPTTPVKLLEEAKSASFIEPRRLRAPQLQVIGQAVEFGSASTAKMVLVNVSNAYDPAKADWRIAHFEPEPAAAE